MHKQYSEEAILTVFLVKYCSIDPINDYVIILKIHFGKQFKYAQKANILILKDSI